MKRIAVIPGDGIGVDITREAMKVLRRVNETLGRELEFTELDWGAEKYLREGITLPPGAFEMLRRDFDAILFGAVGDPRVPDNKHAAEILLALRLGLDLYANVRPVKLFHEKLCPLKDVGVNDVNFTVIRENTEGAYVNSGGVFKQGDCGRGRQPGGDPHAERCGTNYRLRIRVGPEEPEKEDRHERQVQRDGV